MNKAQAKELLRTTQWKRSMLDVAKATVPPEVKDLVHVEGDDIVVTIEDETIVFNRIHADWETEYEGGDFLSILYAIIRR